MTSPPDFVIGLLTLAGTGWMGGLNYILNIAKAVDLLPPDERPRLALLVRQEHSDTLELYRDILPCLDAVYLLGDQPPRPDALDGVPVRRTENLRTALEHVDVVYPIDGNLGWTVFRNRNVVPWIPDFQHLHMPEFFPPEEIARRDASYADIAGYGRMVVLSSQSALEDFRAFFPGSPTTARVLPFHVEPPAPEVLEAVDPRDAQRRHGLPDRFLICCNQFWRHKDHATLFKALALLKRDHGPVALACTGSTHDSRTPDYFDGLVREVAALGIADEVRILGVIDRGDQLALVRRALAVAHPSLFEGWSTVVEDCRSLGRPMVLSDIPVHLEQAPPGAAFFRAGDPDSLAEVLARRLPALEPGPDRAAEAAARAGYRELCLGFARRFRAIMAEATRLAREAGLEPQRGGRL